MNLKGEKYLHRHNDYSLQRSNNFDNAIVVDHGCHDRCFASQLAHSQLTSITQVDDHVIGNKHLPSM